jgi:hypothetical protein
MDAGAREGAGSGSKEINMKKNFRKMALLQGMMAATMLADAMGVEREKREDISNAPTKEYHEWDAVQLTKAERKGKTYEEIQAIRKDKWIKANANKLESRR